MQNRDLQTRYSNCNACKLLSLYQWTTVSFWDITAELLKAKMSHPRSHSVYSNRFSSVLKFLDCVHYPTNCPPLTFNICPLTQFESGPARKAKAPATSSGSPILLNGFKLAICFKSSSDLPSFKVSVPVGPGATQLT